MAYSAVATLVAVDIQGSRVGSVKINILRFLYHTVCGCVLI